jgi:Trk-type K+ transport system membrane component
LVSRPHRLGHGSLDAAFLSCIGRPTDLAKRCGFYGNQRILRNRSIGSVDGQRCFLLWAARHPALIQFGGLGIFTIATLCFIELTGRSTPGEHLVVEETLGAFARDDLKKFLKGVVGITLLIEGTGAVILIVRRLFLDSPSDAIWWGLFHSISAFCNAGFALQDDSLSQSVSDPVVNLTIIALILIGGIGYQK